MKDIGLELRTMIERQHLSQTDIAEKAGFSRAHFWQLIQKKDLTCFQLERICNAMNLDPLIFFELKNRAKRVEETKSVMVENNPTFTVNQSTTDDAHLQDLLKEKEERIQALQKNIDLLEQLLAVYRDGIGTKQQ